MQLNDQQIASLHTLVKTAGVKYYDVQVELVDHLATKIEAEMYAHPTLTFEEGLRQVYASFGDTDFKTILHEKTVHVRRLSNSYFLFELKQFVTLPKVLISITLFLALLLVAPFLTNDNKHFIVIVSSLVITAYQIFNNLTTRKKKVEKVLSLDTIVPGGIWLVVTANYGLNMSVADVLLRSNTSPALFSGIVVFFLLIQVATGNLYEKLARQAENCYPAAFR